MTGATAALDQFQEIVGEEHLLTATETVSSYALEGQQPLAVAFPRSAQEVAALLRTASEAKLSVLLRGSGQHLYLGAPPGPIGLVLSLSRLDRMVEYDAEDLTVTAQAGISLGALQRAVGERGQMLPLDPPGAQSATLGGVVSANLAGPMRMRFGSPRDLVIGMKVVLSTGEIIKTGGRTVKNVAGYDLGKLFIGSLGSVGAIVEITARLVPLPEARAIMMAALSPNEAAEITAWVVNSPLEPLACEILNGPAASHLGLGLLVTVREGGWVLCVGLAGEPEVIARQERELRSRLPRCAGLNGEWADDIWQRVRDLVYPIADQIILRVRVPISAVSRVLALISSYDRWESLSRAGDGLVYALPPAGEPLSDVETKFTALRSAAKRLDGYAILEAGPKKLKAAVSVWGETPNLDLMQKLKRAFDPAEVLGCGRFPACCG